jgi:hypothetical protein
LLVVGAQLTFASDVPPRRTAREALKPFNVLIGSWHALGMPEGKEGNRKKDAWEETVCWEWQFKDGDAWLRMKIDKGKHYTGGTLRYLPDQDQYQLALQTTDKQTIAFTGPLKDHRLIAERKDERTRETQRLVVSLLYENRFLYHYEVQPESYPLASKVYLVGATKEGMPLVKSSDEIGPLCVVSYGPPLTPVAYKGKTYYVCCSSCMQEFRARPEKYIKEYEQELVRLAKERVERNKKP